MEPLCDVCGRQLDLHPRSFSFEISKPTSRDASAPTRPYSLINHKQVHPLRTTYSNILAYGGHSHLHHHRRYLDSGSHMDGL